MDAKTYSRISIINLAFLAAGFGISYLVFNRAPVRIVHAQQQEFEEIAPNITTGSLGVGKLLAGKIATDELTIQGIDILKLQQNLINYVSRTVGTTTGWQGVIADSKAARPMRMAQPKAEPAKPQESKQDESKDKDKEKK